VLDSGFVVYFASNAGQMGLRPFARGGYKFWRSPKECTPMPGVFVNQRVGLSDGWNPVLTISAWVDRTAAGVRFWK